MWLFLFVIIFFICNPNGAYQISKGEVWPKPQYQDNSSYYFVLDPNNFRFTIQEHSECKLFLDKITERYFKMLKNDRKYLGKAKYHRKLENPKNPFNKGVIDNLKIELLGPCQNNEYPHLDSREDYMLVIDGHYILEASSIWGVIRGMETFYQLIYINEDNLFVINKTKIKDYPRFPHRGLLLDTSRHFIPTEYIKTILEAMNFNKMNVFHWHITDDQSFPYQSNTFPELSNEGAYHPVDEIYSQEDVNEIITYARERGIRVIPEFDSPGHTKSWGQAFPELQTQCKQPEILRPLDPISEDTYGFLKKLFSEIYLHFPDYYIHLGGDEVDFKCWSENKNISDFMKENNLTSFNQIENYYMERLLNITKKLNATAIVWEEVFTNGVNITKDTIVQVWKGFWPRTLENVTKTGRRALLSSCWYLDHLASGPDWIKYYECEPLNFNGTDEQKNLVIGGEACMWTEAVNQYNVISRIWPRASAVAEKLWSAQSCNDTEDATKRLGEQTCRMIRRGIGAQPATGPGTCYF